MAIEWKYIFMLWKGQRIIVNQMSYQLTLSFSCVV